MIVFTLSISALGILLGTVFLLGVAPVLAVRLIALIYPKGDPMRSEIVAEMAHVAGLKNIGERWHWLGETFATAACDGVPARRAAWKVRRRLVPIGEIQLLGRLDDGSSVRLIQTKQHREGFTSPADIVASFNAKDLADRTIMQIEVVPTAGSGWWQRLRHRLNR